jgi:hypothetical protein
MTDDGLDPVEVTGRWVGFYRYRSEQLGVFPIVAELRQTGGRITGEMYDQLTDRSDYLADFVEMIGRHIAHEARRRLQQMVRRYGTETVRNSRLPDTSDIQGKINGSHVQFTKTYRGTVEITWSVEETTVASFRRDRHQVQYSGQLDQDRMCIAGRWTIRQWGLFGWFLPPQDWGSFELYRKS